MQRILTLCISATLLGLLLASTAAAKSPRVVDPASVMPPLNPSFTWSCFDTGAGPICQGTLEVNYENEPIDSDFDEIDVMRGPHDLYSDFEAVEQAVCALLA